MFARGQEPQRRQHSLLESSEFFNSTSNILLHIIISYWFVINRTKCTSNYRTRVQISKAFYRMKTKLQWQFLSFHVTQKQHKGASDLFSEERKLKFRKLRVLNIALSTILSFGNHTYKSYCSAIFKYFFMSFVQFSLTISTNYYKII